MQKGEGVVLREEGEGGGLEIDEKKDFFSGEFCEV